MDPYTILGMVPGTPMAQVKAQFRRLAKSVHPDRNGSDAGCQERLRRINAAYEFLSDPVRKAAYDAYAGQMAMPDAPAPQDVMAVQTAAFRPGGPSRAVPLLVLWTVLACVIVAVACAVSQQGLGFYDPVPTVTIAEPTGPAIGSPSDGQAFAAPVEQTVPASGVWPTPPAGASGPVADGGSPSPATAPAPAAAWPAGETGSFPSR